MRSLYVILLSSLITMIPSNITDMNMPAPKVRPATQAGRFYEGDAQVLRMTVDSLIERHTGTITSYTDVAALIVPHAGYYFSGNVAAAGYAQLDPDRNYKRVFLIGPSHYVWLDGASVNVDDDEYATPLGTVRVDKEAGKQLMAADSVFTYDVRAHDREHCLEVQLPFLQRRLKHVPPIVPIIVNTNDYHKLQAIAQHLKKFFNDENLFVISSDFSHYPSYADAYVVDGKTREAVMSGSVERFIHVLECNAKSGIRNLDTSACGEYAIITLMLMLDKGYEIRHLLYQNSGDIDHHDHSRVVGYHAFAVNRKKGEAPNERKDDTFSLSDDEKHKLKEIARQSILAALNHEVYTPQQLTPALKQQCGAFVSLHKHGELRGCIGHFGEDMPLYETVYEMARAAAFEDPRFTQLRKEEMDDVEIEISVLTPMRRIKSIEEFELHKHGIYMRKGFRSGTFLPQVADEVNWTKEEFLGHCARDKAGLGWDGWRDAELYIYEAIVF